MSMSADEVALADALAAAAKRHDDTLNMFFQSSRNLFSTINTLLDKLKPAPYRSRSVLSTRIETESGVSALIVRSSMTNKPHLVGTRVLNFQTLGLGYHPSNGALCGFVQVILSNGDYWQKIKQAKLNPLVGLAVGMMSQQLVAGMVERSKQQIEAVEGISREVLDEIWTHPDQPDVWLSSGHGDTSSQLVLKDYVYALVDRVFNPECKEWTYKSN